MSQKYTIDKNFFINDSTELFYFAGILAADGHLIKNKKKNNKISYTIGLTLKEDDKEHLIQLQKLIKSNHKLTQHISKDSLRNSKYKDSVSYMLRFSGLFFKEALERFNIAERKSLIYEIPEWLLLHKYVNHFMRGYFDGDGSVCINKKNQLQIHIRGTQKFLEQFHNIIYYNFPTIKKDKIISKDSGIYSLQYNGNNISRQIYDFLYKDDSISLKRKKDIFEKLLK